MPGLNGPSTPISTLPYRGSKTMTTNVLRPRSFGKKEGKINLRDPTLDHLEPVRMSFLLGPLKVQLALAARTLATIRTLIRKC